MSLRSLAELFIKERQSMADHKYDDIAKQIILCGIAIRMIYLQKKKKKRK